MVLIVLVRSNQCLISVFLFSLSKQQLEMIFLHLFSFEINTQRSPLHTIWSHLEVSSTLQFTFMFLKWLSVILHLKE